MLEFSVLGPVEARREGVRVPIGPSQRTLLSALLCRPGHVVAASELAAAVSRGRVSTGDGSANLQVSVHRLRRTLGDPAWIEFQPPGYRLATDGAEFDLARFEDLVANARSETSGANPDGAVRAYDRALAVWRGEPYAGIDDVEPIRAERNRLVERRTDVAEARLAAVVAIGGADGVVHEVNELAAAHPYRERLQALRLDVLARSGRRAEALAAYRQIVELFAIELGVKPGAELQSMAARLRSGAVRQPDRLIGPQAVAGVLGRARDRLAVGDHPAAIALARQALDAGDEPAGAREVLGVSLREQGRFDEAYAHLTVALAEAVSRQDITAEARALQLLAIVERERAKYSRAARLLERADGIQRDLGDRVHQACMRLSQGELGLRIGDKRATTLIHDGLSECEQMSVDFGVAYGSRLLGQLALDAGRPADALPWLASAARLSRSAGAPFAFAVTLFGLGRAHAGLGHAVDARQAWRRAMRVFDGIGYLGASQRVNRLLGTLT